MKKIKKLTLNKSVISTLNPEEAKSLQGGSFYGPCSGTPPVCPTIAAESCMQTCSCSWLGCDCGSTLENCTNTNFCY